MSVFDVFFADLCVLCDLPLAVRTDHLTCPHCWSTMPEIITTCPACEDLSTLPHQCPRTPGTGLLLAPYPHEGSCRHLVHQLKYHHDLRAGKTLAVLMGQAVRWAYQNDQLPEVLYPVPLSYVALVRRGYNQSEWLARQLSNELRIPQARRAIKRRHGPRQVSRNRKARLSLPPDAFRMRGPANRVHAAIVDDVYTTGATTRALAKTLVAAGIQRVDIWCATRAR